MWWPWKRVAAPRRPNAEVWNETWHGEYPKAALGLDLLGMVFGTFGAQLVAYTAGVRFAAFNYSEDDATKDFERLWGKYGRKRPV